MAATYRSLQLSEARHRFDLLRVTSYDVTLDLAASETTFPSRTAIRFESATCRGWTATTVSSSSSG